MKKQRRSIVLLTVINIFLVIGSAGVAAPASVRVATFDVDVTPPVGSAMAYDPVKRVDELTLRCRGVVLLGSDKPVVLCAVDWIGIGNGGQDAFREALAGAAGTTPDRVAVHTLHQHDAPGCDFAAEQILRELGVQKLGRFEGAFQRQVLQRAADAVTESLASAQVATHYGWGVGEVQKVASNRRILGADGNVSATRWTATKDRAGGNIGAGKYNDGAKENRMRLAIRLADGMQRAWETTKKHSLTVDDLGWQTVPVNLPVAEHLNEAKLIESIKAESSETDSVGAARKLAWLRRCKTGQTIHIGCLRVGQARVLHMPGELFVEYQLAAKAMRPDLHVTMAAYGDYGPGYIGTTVAYGEGGYETSPRASSVAPGVEPVLTVAVRQLLKADRTAE